MVFDPFDFNRAAFRPRLASPPPFLARRQVSHRAPFRSVGEQSVWRGSKPHDGFRRKQAFSLIIGNDRVWVGSRHRSDRAANGGFGTRSSAFLGAGFGKAKPDGDLMAVFTNAVSCEVSQTRTFAFHPFFAGSMIVKRRQKRPSELARWPPALSDLAALRQDESILYIDPEGSVRANAPAGNELRAGQCDAPTP